MVPVKSKKKDRFFSFFFILPAIILLVACQPILAAEKFPLYPSIKANVKFWEDVYSRYTTRQGIIHDTNDLSRVYMVIDLVDWETTNAAQINSDRVKAAKDRIKEILLTLGDGTAPRTAEERRVAALFPPQRHTVYHSARDTIRLQIGQSDRFYEGVIRSGKYLAAFRQIFHSMGLPPELAYLPHVESSFNPKAYSKAGAAGLWQFTRSTGKEYLTINDLVDERYDPHLATRAAAQLLKDNFEQLQSWPLAVTAYNYGRNGMLRAVREMGSYENIFTSYDQGAFKFASRNFYSEFLAAIRVASRMGNNRKFPFEQPEATISLQLKEDTPAKRIQSSFRVSAESFSRLNPALLRPVLDGQKLIPRGYLVRLPANKNTAPRLVR
jgi:membrane-bound lytic murein transglycosylase D